MLMYVFTVLFLCFSDCHDSTCAFLVITLVCVKCFNIDIRIYGTLLILAFLSF